MTSLEKLKNSKVSDAQIEEYFEYLDDLRDSGITNMYGASPYLSEAYGISKYEARDVLSAWMETYDKRHPVDSKEE